MISRTSCFKKDYKREARGQYGATLDVELLAVVSLLATDSSLLERFRDHPLTGEWTDHRDCHVRPDLVLIYRIPDPDRLELVRLGSHSELSLYVFVQVELLTPLRAGWASRRGDAARRLSRLP